MDYLLAHNGRTSEPYEIICLVGHDLADWSEPQGREQSREILKTVNARVVTYHQLIGNARRAYAEYLKASKTANRIYGILDAIDASF